MTDNKRPHVYDETIKLLEQKDFAGLAALVSPTMATSLKETDSSFLPLSINIPDMREMDYFARHMTDKGAQLLHIEFETAYKSNAEMMRRMLRYYTYIHWHYKEPLFQAVVVLKKPKSLKNIKGEYKLIQSDDSWLKFKYKVIKVYEMHKDDILKTQLHVLYPLRVFMQHDHDNEFEHLNECLRVVESIEDKDFYFLTVQCIEKLNQLSTPLKLLIKEDLLMHATLYRRPFEKGVQEGLEKGIEKGIEKGKLELIIRLLTRRFGPLSNEVLDHLSTLDEPALDAIGDRLLVVKTLEDALCD